MFSLKMIKYIGVQLPLATILLTETRNKKLKEKARKEFPSNKAKTKILKERSTLPKMKLSIPSFS